MNEHLSLLVGRYIPNKVIRVRNKDKPLSDDQSRRAFDLKQEADLRWTRNRFLVNWEVCALTSELMKHTRRSSVCLISEIGMFL